MHKKIKRKKKFRYQKREGGPVIPKGYLVEEIRNGLFWITDGVFNTIFLVTNEGVIAVDAPPSIGKNYLKAISEVTDKPITHVIYSHDHIDHIGSAGMFPKNAVISLKRKPLLNYKSQYSGHECYYCSTNTYESFSNNYTLDWEPNPRLDYYGDNHLPGNIFIYAPKQKVLMLVDVIFPGLGNISIPCSIYRYIWFYQST